MRGKPKFKVGESVQFFLDGEGMFNGEVYIVDAYGTFEDPSSVSYDIMVHNYGLKKEACLFKHIPENIVSSYNPIEIVNLGI